MKEPERKQHWDTIYHSKDLEETSWFQPTPLDSLKFIEELNIPKSASIIDVGGGESLLVDHLLDLGFEDLTVVDVSKVAIAKAKQRLGSRADLVNWIVSDVTSFEPTRSYDLWHDRATFHFLTDDRDIYIYVKIASQAIKAGGFLIIGTFSKEGPDRCSGLAIKNYSDSELNELFSGSFVNIHSTYLNHKTPSGQLQNFVFCSFRKTEIIT